MAILKRINKYQGLKDIDVLIEESGLSSKYFNIYDVPTNVPQGRSSFLLAGSPFLKNFVELKVEILDSAGQTVYSEPVANYLEGNARRISVEVYDDTAPGDGFLYLVGELKDNYRSVSGQQQQNIEITDNFLTPEDRADFIEHSNDVPSEFQNVYNVRYVRPIFINTVIPNSEPIFFYQQPRVTISEILKGYVVETTVSSSYEITGSVSVEPIPDLPPKAPDPDPIQGFSAGMKDGARDEVGAELEIFKNRRKAKIDPLRNNRFAKSGRITRRASPEIDRFTINVDQMETSPENTTSDAVTSAFVGGEITIKNPKVNTTEYPPDEYTIPTEYKSSIKKVNNEKTLVPLDDFVITKKDTGEKIPVKIEQGGEGESSSMEVTMSVVPTPPQVISTTHYRSYADIIVANLGTFSGDVYKAKIYAKSKGTLGDFEPVYDASIESPQVLIDAYSPTGFKNTGYFYTQSIVDDYWVSSSNSTATQDNSVFIDGVLISGSNAGFTPENSTVNTVQFNTSQSYELQLAVPYTIEFNAYYYKEDKSDENGDITKQAELEVFLSGSAITGDDEEDYKLGKVTVKDGETEGKVYGVHNTFTSATSGDPKTYLKFKVTSGRWIIQDIILRPHSETNFNPAYFRTVVPMEHPLPKKPDQYDFLVEFYDLNNNIAEAIGVKENITFAGAPINIDGDGNLLSGSLYLGGVQGEGIEVHGGSAYLRSLTYEGFDKTIADGKGGFLLWSGSVGEQIDSSEDYDGVGLEIVDAHGATDRYLQFKTDPSTFKVQTDEFFLGSSTQFVSGSSGNIEISSSNFHLTPEGNVTMSGTISATAGNIGDFQIIDGKISGSNITMDANTSTIYKTDQGPGSDDAAAFDQLRDEYYIDFTPEAENPDNYYIKMGPMFMVDKDGILIASGATFEGSITASAGLIGGFTTDSHSFYSSNIFISGSPAAGGINQDKYMFISTSNWNVKQGGQQTGSEVLFTGGTIGGFTLSSTALTGGSTGTTVALTPGTGIHMGHATFGSAPFSVTNAGVIKAESGTIGGFTLSATQLSATNFVINAPNKSITLGTSDDVIIIDADVGIQVGDATFDDAEFSVDIRGNLRAVSGSIAGWGIDSNKIFKDNIQLQSNNSIISIGGTTFGSAGIQLQYDSQGKFYAGDGSTDYIKFTSAGVDIKTANFELDTETIDISSSGRRIQMFGLASRGGKEWIRIGEISTDTSDKFGIKVYDGTGTADSDLIAMFGEIGNKIAGWEFTDTQMRSIPAAGLGGVYDFDAGEDGIIIQANAQTSSIETAGFVSGLKGFRMSSLGNGSAEFENMRIRGTLRTTVFEKESVNVVGGQLMVANSTTIQALKSGSVVLAGSSSVSTTDVTMSVANASGFSRGEILKVKAIGDTGFSVEYLYVTGSKRYSEDSEMAYLTGSEDAENNAPPLDPDGIAGELYVGRGYGSTGPSQISSSISVLSAGISLNESGGEPEFGTIDTISVDATGSLAIQDILKIDEEKMKITAIAGTGTAASASLTVVRDFQDTIPSIHNAGTAVYKFNPDMQFLAGLVSSARPYQEGQVLVSTGKYASGTGYHDKFSYNANVSDTPNANGEYRILSGSTHITTNVTGSTHLEIYKIDKDAVDHNSLFSLFDKSSYIVILIDGTDEWVRFRVSGNPTVAGNVHTYPISLNQDFYQVQTPATDTTSDDVDFWFLSNIQDVSSGYIMMNANPNDPYSPYMDFVERTGPDVYDLQLRTRLGDLSGLSSAYLYGEEEPGFGLYTENGFFKGTIHAMTGSIHGILNVATSQGGIETGQKITIGRGVDGTHDGFRINNNNYWFTTGEFRLGDATNYLHVSGTEASIASNISIKTDDLNIDTTNFDVSTDNGGSIALGSLTNVNPATTNKGFYTSGSGATLIKGSATSNDDYVLFDTNGVQIRTQDVSIVTTGTNKLKIDSTGTPVIAMGSGSLPTAYNSGTGFFVDGTGKLLLGIHNGNRIQWDGSNITLVGTIRQSLAGQTYTDFVNRGTWAHTTAYISGSDLVTYNNGTNTSTYLCKNSHTSTNDSDTTTGNPESATNSWNVYAAGSTGADGEDGEDGVDGAEGADGSAGADARVVNLTMGAQAFTYNTAGATPSPANTSVTASAGNTSGSVYYDFLLNDSSVQNTTAVHYTYTPQASFTNMPDKIEVQIREGSAGGTVKARDMITAQGLQEGTDAITVQLTNEAHTLPVTTAGVVTYTGSGTDIRAWSGTTALSYNTSGVNTFSVATTVSNITIGAASTVSTYTRRFADHSSMTQDIAAIGYSITTRDAAETATTLIQSQSFAKSHQGSTGAAGASGSDGASAANISIGASSQVFALDDSSDTSLTPTYVTLTVIQSNQASNLVDGDLAVDNSAAKSNFSYSGADGTGTATWRVTPDGYESGDFPIIATVSNDSLSDSITLHRIVGGADGVDAYTVILTNEAHVIPQGSTQGLAARTYTNSGTQVIAYKGTTELDSTTSTPGAGGFKVTATGTNITPSTGTVTGNPFVFPDHSGMNSDNASIGYSVNLENSATFPKSQSFTTSQAAGSGSDGTSVTGDDGAGVVYRGEWSASVAYVVNSGRKDIVKSIVSPYEYWIAKSSHTSGASTSPNDGGSYATYWETFGAVFSSVATDILFADDVYADRTVNIGSTGITPVIALNSDYSNNAANPYIGIGVSSYAAHDGIYLGFDSTIPKLSLENSGGDKYFRWTGASLEVDAGNLTIDASGDITATNVDLTGVITADTGYIGGTSGWVIATGKITSSGIGVATSAGDGTYAFWAGHDTAATAEFSVTHAGAIKATSGTIGGWALSSTTITGDQIELDMNNNNGRIRMGSSLPNSATDGTGFYADGDGTFLVGSSAGNRIQYTAGGAIVLQSNTFALNTSTVVIDSGVNYGKIAFGNTPPTSAAYTSNAGIYMDGTGEFLVRGDGSNYIKMSSGALQMFAESFYLAGGGTDLIISSNPTYIRLSNGLITLDGRFGGVIEAGNLTSTNPVTAGKGVYISGSGEVLIKAAVASNQDYLLFNSDGLEIKTKKITFETDGTITSQDYLIERSRLFGAGVDEDVTISGTTTLTQDMYYDDLTVTGTLNTNGFRVYVKGTLDNSGTIQCRGFAGSQGADFTSGTAGTNGGAGGAGGGYDEAVGVYGTLHSGSRGGYGGKGGIASTAGAPSTDGKGGAGGGGAGGQGGIMFISARILDNVGGTITVQGGTGGRGGHAEP